MATIRLKGIAHCYEPSAENPVYALQPFDLEWENGGTYALLGPSGCGKSTMLNIMSGLLTPSKGQVLIDDRDVTTEPIRKRNIAQVFQFPVIYKSKTVYENLAFPLRCRKLNNREIKIRVHEVAELLSLETMLQKRAYTLTPEAKQLISVGRGLVRSDVSAILMDEPLTVIDPHMKFHLRRKLKEISARYQHTLVYVTHDQNEAMTLADKVVVMDHGRIMQIGSPQELFEFPCHQHVGYFIGSPTMNFLPCHPEPKGVRIGNQHLPMAISKIPKGEQFLLGIRPEFVSIEDGAGASRLAAEITDIQNAGKFLIVRALVSGNLVRAKVPTGTQIELGAAYLGFNPTWLRLYADRHLVV